MSTKTELSNLFSHALAPKNRSKNDATVHTPIPDLIGKPHQAAILPMRDEKNQADLHKCLKGNTLHIDQKNIKRRYAACGHILSKEGEFVDSGCK